MKPLDPFQFAPKECLKELDALDALLKTHPELDEDKDILPFFRTHKNLAAFIASYAPTIVNFDRLSPEYNLYGDFRADLVVGDSNRRSYCFIEFEDAKKESIFKHNGRTTSEWSPRFEHGYSQIVDWLWKVEDFRQTSQARAIFGDDAFAFMGMLVIGRDQFLQPEERTRLKWRMEKVVVNSQKIVCVTLDQLATDLRTALLSYQAFAKT